MPLEEDCWEGVEIEREKVVLQVASSLHLWEKEHCRLSGRCEFAPASDLKLCPQKMLWLLGAAGTGCGRCGQSQDRKSVV